MPKKLSSSQFHKAFLQGELSLQGQFMLGSNYTFLATLTYEEHEIPVVYKPKQGEQPLWDFPESTLSQREVAAYLVSEALGFGLVPFTALRENAQFGPGSLQLYIDYNPSIHYFSFSAVDKARLDKVALFDHLINNADRKGSHVLLQKRTRKLFAIDHGLCFHAEDKLRTVIWDFAGQPFAAEYLSALEALRQNLISSELRAGLSAYLSAAELDSLQARAEALIEAGVFPQPIPGRRVFPYPPL